MLDTSVEHRIKRVSRSFCVWLTRTLHLGGSQKKIACSQRMFKASQVDRLAHGAYLAAKAWNSRILLQWLHESAVQAATLQNFDSAGGRTLGVWLAEEVRAGRKAWPTASDTPFLFLEPLASHFGCKVLSALIMIFVMLHPRHARG